jgi:hypothetical protein
LSFWLAIVGEALTAGTAKVVTSIISTVKADANAIAMFLLIVINLNHEPKWGVYQSIALYCVCFAFIIFDNNQP